MRILVLGGTTYLSKAVAVEALARDHEVIVAARGISGEPPQGARFVHLDRDDPAEGLAQLARQTYDAVVDVARVPAHVKSVVEVLAGKAKHWTFVSTISVYRDEVAPGRHPENVNVHEPVETTSSATDMSLYGASKVTCENLVRQHLGQKAFIPRPGLIIGPGDPSYRFGYWPDRLAEGGQVLAPGAPANHTQWIDVRDHATWIVHAAEHELAGTFDTICRPAPMSQLLDEVGHAMGGGAELTWVSDDFLLEHGVAPWAGADSIGMWVPRAAHAGSRSLDASPALAAGLTIRPVADSARDWFAAAADQPRDDSERLSRKREAEILRAWQQGAENNF